MLATMTLGLLVSDENGIYLAIESQGLLGPEKVVGTRTPWPITSKIIELQAAPTVVVLASGGLDHWNDVARKYSSQPSPTAAAREIVRLLNVNMDAWNQAFGLACGYEDPVPKCYRINRPQGVEAAEFVSEETLGIVQALGEEEHAEISRRNAQRAIGEKVPPLKALVDAIEQRFPGNNIRPPIDVRTIRFAAGSSHGH